MLQIMRGRLHAVRVGPYLPLPLLVPVRCLQWQAVVGQSKQQRNALGKHQTSILVIKRLYACL